MKRQKEHSTAAETKEKILSLALEQSSKFGLEGLTIGKLAQGLGMSKSGLFGHFGSKERLQIEVLNHVALRFTHDVLLPAFKEPRGLPRIKALASLWVQWSQTGFQGGCPIAAAVMEFDDRPGPVRDQLLKLMKQQHQTLVKLAEVTIQAGDFSPSTDPEQFAFEVSAIMLGFHQSYRFLEDKDVHLRLERAFDALIQRFSP